MASPHVGDIGTPIIFTIYQTSGCVVDLSTSGSTLIYLINPSGSRIQKTASLVTDGKDGKMQYVIQSGDWNVSGQWKAQGWVSLSNGSWYTNVENILVLTND